VYTNVHMLVSITDFRQDIFRLIERVVKNDEEIELEKNGVRVAKIVPIKDEDSPAKKADYALKYILPRLAGAWKDVPQEEFDRINEQFRGKKAKQEARRLRKAW